MSTFNKSLKVKMGYGDLTTRIYTIDINHIPNESMTNYLTYAKAKIEAINTAAQDTNSSVANTFVSKSGAKFTGIIEGSVVISQEDILYNGG